MASFRTQFLSLMVAVAILLQFACCPAMAKSTELPAALKAAHACCGESQSAPHPSHEGKPGEPCKQCPIMSGDHASMNQVVLPTSVTPDFASPIIAIVLDVMTPPTVSLSREVDACVKATSPPSDLLHEHCQLLL